MEPIKLYVGTAPNGEDAESCMVLEYTAKTYSSIPVDITWMRMSHDVDSPWYCGSGGWDTSKWATPFSGFRWGIPEACGYKGRALYLDSDMIILQDLKELWEMDLEGKLAAVKRKDRSCVMLWDCELVGKMVQQELLPAASRTRQRPEFHHYMMQLFSISDVFKFFDRQWNNFDGENDNLEDIKILHYTDMSTQPHAKYAIPRLEAVGKNHWFDGDFRTHRRSDVVELFDHLYNMALQNGYTVEQYIPNPGFGPYSKQTQKGYVANNGFDVTKGE